MEIYYRKNGKPSANWRGMYRAGAYDDLVIRALPVLGSDVSASRWFVRVFAVIGNMFLLRQSTVELLGQVARSGNAYALFALGRYHLGVHPDPDSTERAMNCFEEAWRKGLPEAATALAMAYDYGEAGIMDWHRAKDWLNKSLEMNCDYAAEYMLRKMVYGLRGTSENPQKALEISDAFIEQETELYGEEDVNPMWYYCKGCAEQAVYGWTHAAESFRIAADKGLVMAHGSLAVAISHNDEGEFVDSRAFSDAVRAGAEKRDAACTYFLARLEAENIGNLPEAERSKAFEQYITILKAAMALGSYDAAEELGDIYSSKDTDASFRFYAHGAMLNGVSCYEKAFALVYDGLVDRPVAFRDMLALHGARLESELLTDETVKAYKAGRMTEFASEIERYYL